MLNDIINSANKINASDIHIEPECKQYRIRLRKDGLLYDSKLIDFEPAMRLITKIKLMAKLDITERRLPQDGHFQHENTDLRVSSCLTVNGEKIVLRLQQSMANIGALNQLGLSNNQLTTLINRLKQPHGLILVTGPTGSGKSRTLYSILQHLNDTSKNIVTIEDPVEINLAGINQVNIHRHIGLTFASTLKSILRQDPDIIMIGEIRDKETAEIAIQAADTGHLVLSTLHTPSALQTINRLQSIGAQTHQLMQPTTLFMAQRLIRMRCQNCQACCDTCNDGYHGRTGIFEMLPITPELAKLCESKACTKELVLQLKKGDFISLNESAKIKIQQGITSSEEVNRVLGTDYYATT